MKNKNKLFESIESEMHAASEEEKARVEEKENDRARQPISSGFLSSFLARIPSLGNGNGGGQESGIQTESLAAPLELQFPASKELKKSQKKIIRLEGALAREATCQSKLASEKKEAEQQISEFQAALKKAREESAGAYGQLHEKQTEADSLIHQLELEKCNPLLSSARAELEEKKRELAELAKQLAQEKSKEKKSKATLVFTQSKIVSMKKEVSSLEQSVASRGEKLALLGKEIHDLDETLRDGKEQLHFLERKTSERQQAVESFEREKLELEKNISETVALLEQSQHSEASLQAQVRQLKNKLASRKRKLSQCQQSIQSFSEQLSSLEQRVPSTEHALKELLLQLHELEAKSSEKRSALAQLEANKSELSGKLKDARKSFLSAEQSVEELENETASLARAIRRSEEKERLLKEKTGELSRKQVLLEREASEAEKNPTCAEPSSLENSSTSLAGQKLERLSQGISFSDSFTREFINSCEFGENFTEKQAASLNSRGFRKTRSSNSLVRMLLSKLVGRHGNLSFFFKPMRKTSSIEKEFAVWLAVMLLGRKHGGVRIHENGPHDVTFKEGKLAVSLSKQENTVLLAGSNSEKLLSKEELDQLFD